MLLCSLLLRPICRSMLRVPLSWLARERRAFAWSLLLAAVAGFFAVPLMGGKAAPLNWSEWPTTWVKFAVILFLWCSLYVSVKQWEQSEREREQLLRAESELREARLSALRYQLNPHFLFNSLNAVSTLVLEGQAEAASRMLSQISEFLRSTLDISVAAEVPLSQEVLLAERYLAIEQARLGDRLRVSLDVAPDTLDALVPSLLLQPLVENAVRHGIAPQLEGGAIAIHVERRDSRLQLRVSNSGSACHGAESSLAKGIGLTNTSQRLETLYGAGHNFTLRFPQDGGCEVALDLPYHLASGNAHSTMRSTGANPAVQSTANIVGARHASNSSQGASCVS